MSKQKELSKEKKFKFHVIELLEPPYTDPEKYVCVPNSWTRLHETSDGVALVKFPVEKLSEVKKRVKKQEFSEKWSTFLADLKYSTNSYKDASNYIKILNKISDQEQSTKIVKDVPSTSDKKVFETQSRSETNKVGKILTLNTDVEPMSQEISKQLDLTNAEVRIRREKSIIGTTDSSPKARRYLTRQSLKVPLSGNYTASLPNQTTKETLPSTRHCVEDSDKTKNNQENEPSAKNSSELIRKWQLLKALRSVFGGNFKETLEQLHCEYEKNQLVLEKMQLAHMENCKIIKQFIELTNDISNGRTITTVFIKVFGDNFKETFEQLHCEYGKTQLVLEKMRLAFMENCKIIKEFIELTNEISNCPDISESAVKELENSMTEVNINENNSDKATGSKVQNDTRKKEEKKYNSDSTEVKNNNPLNKIRGQARKFTLPPEYDPNDSRWTLKHREMKSGLVELLPYSRVYIDAIQLSNCKITSKDSKTLTRMLLLEIFTKNALSICSLTGTKPNAFDLEGTGVRPGLDEHARIVLLNYIKKHAAEQNWGECDSKLIWNTIRNKMQDMRGKN